MADRSSVAIPAEASLKFHATWLSVAVVINVAPSVSAQYEPPPDSFLGQDLLGPRIVGLVGTWTLRWCATRCQEWEIATVGEPTATAIFDDRSMLLYSTLTGLVSAVTLTTSKASDSISFREMFERCEPQPEIRSEPARAWLPRVAIDGRYTPEELVRPRCGSRMAESFEREGANEHITCFDKVDGTGFELDITFVAEHLSWVWSPAPFEVEVNRARGPPWPYPAACGSMFVPNDAPLVPQKNVAFELAWGEGDDLVSIQTWVDDHETGAFLAFYADGRPMTVGYRWEGLAHGLWWYFAADGRYLGARLFGLGVELRELAATSEP